ncbi:MAG: type IV pilus secretin PilQ [Candidatus Hydrothermae bacterium]|nr:type IV pilus secretin PilQ [Candidatus Hydrothermae bacterium]
MKAMIVKSFILMALIGSGLYSQEIHGERLVSMDFENADIRTVLRAFADIGGVNIIATKGVQGTVTLKLRNLPWKQALKAVLEINGFSMIEEDNIIKVMTAAEMEDSKKAMKLETRIFNVKFAKADKLEGVISGMLSSRGSIKVESRTNSLIVTDIPMVMSRIEDILARVDNPTPQVLVKAKLVEVNYGALRELGVVWRAGNMEDVRTSTHSGAELSVPPPASNAAFYFGKLLSQAQLDLVISTLEDENKANVLSEPSILVADNQEAMILSGKKIPIVTRDFAGNQIIQFFDVALKLTVTPHISPDGKIVMDLHPVISDIAGEAPGAVGPVISSQEAQTKLTVNNGETVVIGGIIKTQSQDVKKGVPLLSSIPIIGNLFKYTKHEVNKTELMIFVTPQIVETTASE